MTKKGTRRRRTVHSKKQVHAARTFTPRERLLLLDTWQRSGLSAAEFASLCGASKHTLYAWKQRFDREGPAGLQTSKRKKRKSRIPDATRRAVLLLKSANPDWGCQRLRDVLERADGFAISPGSIRKILLEDGYEVELPPSRPHPDKPRRFELARPNELWQTDLFTFVLKRLGRRVHLVAFMDDHSRFIVGFGLHGSATGAMVREAFLSAIGRFGPPLEVLTDNGPQYTSWRGKSAFTKLTEKLGVRQVVSRPRRPQTLGKIERWWSSLWSECLEKAIFRDIDDARTRLGLFVDHYNFHRPHQGIGGLVPADRFFEAGSTVRESIEREVHKNSLDLARHGVPRKPFYLTGKLGDANIALHAEGDRVILTHSDGRREEVQLAPTGRRAQPGDPTELPGVATEMSPFASGALSVAPTEEVGESASPVMADTSEAGPTTSLEAWEPPLESVWPAPGWTPQCGEEDEGSAADVRETESNAGAASAAEIPAGAVKAPHVEVLPAPEPSPDDYPAPPLPAPGSSVLDEALNGLCEAMEEGGD